VLSQTRPGKLANGSASYVPKWELRAPHLQNGKDLSVTTATFTPAPLAAGVPRLLQVGREEDGEKDDAKRDGREGGGIIRLIQCITLPEPALGESSLFPHMVQLNGALSAEDEACEWQQIKTRFTGIEVQLQDEKGAPQSNSCPNNPKKRITDPARHLASASCPVSVAGQPVLGSTLQDGGLELQLTLLNATTMKELSDDDNPRPKEGLFSGLAGRQFEPTVRLTGSAHTFKCKVMLLSSDIGGALVMIKVARPNADADDPLCVVTRAFLSRARSAISRSDLQGSYNALSPPDAAFRSLGAGDEEVEPGLQFR
jgi:hypothetical protein